MKILEAVELRHGPREKRSTMPRRWQGFRVRTILRGPFSAGGTMRPQLT